MDLITWLQSKLIELGWSQAELARRSGISQSQISHVINGQRRAGADFCIAISGSLGVEPYVVLKMAGWLPKTYEPKRDILTRLLEAAASLPDDEIVELVALADVKRKKTKSASSALSAKGDAAG